MAISYKDSILLFNHYPRTLLEFLSLQGHDPKAVLRELGMSVSLYDDLGSTISYSQYALLIMKALSLHQGDALGLAFGRHLGITHHGMLGVAIMSSATLGDALQLMEQYYSLLSPVLVIEQKQVADLAVLQANAAWSLGALQLMAVECLLAGLYHNCLFILQRDHVDCRFRFSHDPPAYLDQYQRYFCNPVEFNQVADQILIPISMLETPLPLANPVLCQQAIEQVDRQMMAFKSRESLVLKLRRLPIISTERVLSLDEAAESLFMSSRSLRRHLKELGISYQQLLDKMRSEKAIELLQQPSISVASIAEQLHFSDTANFRKAFKRWFAVTPREYRSRYLC